MENPTSCREIIDELSSKSESVCIKSSEVNSISELSDDCDGANEYLLDCPGTLNNFTCKIINNTFFVTGLEHSAVLEFLPKEPCFPEWNCNTWSNSRDQCGYRTCADINDCGDVTGMPDEYKKCPPVCVPDWECTAWEPEKCPKSEKMERDCEDLNNCGKDTGKPITSQSCEYENNTLLWILLGFSVLLLGLVLFVGLRSPKKHRKIQEETHNPHPDDEFHEDELTNETPQTYVPDKKEDNFEEFKQNKR